MTAAAAKKFADEVKKTIAQWQKDTDFYYQKCIKRKEKPTPDDLKQLAQMVKWARATSEAYAATSQAYVGFGGTQDNKIKGVETMLRTMMDMAKK